jgi:hypothetical protein
MRTDHNGARAAEHQLVVLSRHATSQGIVTYARCSCGNLQIWLTAAGRPARRLAKVIPGARPVVAACGACV